MTRVSAVPPSLGDAPAHTALEDGMRDDIEAIRETSRLDLDGCLHEWPVSSTVE